MTIESKSGDEVLNLTKNLLEKLHDSNIPYCHWKSNIDIDRWLMGEDDLDLLIDRRYSSAFYQILQYLGFKRGIVNYERQFPGMEDFYGWDRESDLLIHLHVHYQLVLGAVYVKSLHLPIEQKFIRNRKEHKHIATSSAEFELLAFMLRYILRIRLFDLIKWRKYSSKIVEELNFLEANGTRENLNETLSQLDISAKLFEDMKTVLRSRSPWRISWLKLKLEKHIRPFQRFGVFTRLVRPLVTRLKYRLFKGSSSGTKSASGGMIIAVVGCDGSGKSSMVNELHNWLGNNYSVKIFHLGRPKQSILSYIMLRVAILIKRISSRFKPNHSGYFARIASVISEYFVAQDRFRAYKMIRRWVGQGKIAIADRFPIDGIQMDTISANLRHTDSKNYLLRWISSKIAKYYQVFSEPNLLIVLKVPLDVAARRRPQDSKNYLKDRIKATESIEPKENILIIDASKEHSKVKLEAKEFVWKWL